MATGVSYSGLSVSTSSWSIIATISKRGRSHDDAHAHSGEILREDVLAALRIKVTDAAERLDMSRPTLSRVINGRAGISPDLALRLEMAGVSTDRFWMTLQARHERAQASQRQQPTVLPLRGAA